MSSDYAQVLSDLQIDVAANGAQGELLALLAQVAANDTSSAVSGLDYAADVLAKIKKYLPADGGHFTREVIAPLQAIVGRRSQGLR